MVAPPLTSASSASTSPFPTLTDLLYRLASGSVTSVELTRQSLDAIDASQPTLNAFRVVLRQEALVEAAKADRRRTAGRLTPLLGIPIAAVTRPAATAAALPPDEPPGVWLRDHGFRVWPKAGPLVNGH